MMSTRVSIIISDREAVLKYLINTPESDTLL